MKFLLGYNQKIVIWRGNKNLVGEYTGGNFSRWVEMSKFLASGGNPPPIPPVGKTLKGESEI